jgi:AcrR family transcriptional regulator
MTKPIQRQHSAHTKKDILEAAEKLFADKGFDGTGIMEIAIKADVPKSLIYYYFESKDEILKELVNRLIQDTIHMKLNAVKDQNPEDAITKEGFIKMFDISNRFFIEHRRMFKIIFQESLKKEFIGNFLLNVQISQQESIDYLKNAGMSVNENDLKLGHIFLLTLPFIMFDLFRDKWCEINGYDPEIAQEKFIDLMSDVSLLVTSRSIIT